MLFGGEAIEGFAYVMFFGVFVCTYSAVFISSPVLIYLGFTQGAEAPSQACRTAGWRSRRSERLDRRPVHDGFVPGRHPIDAYGNGGFRFAEMSHRGSILALPSGMRAWDVTRPREVTADALAPVLPEGDAIELLLLGTGVRRLPFAEALRSLPRGAASGST